MLISSNLQGALTGCACGRQSVSTRCLRGQPVQPCSIQGLWYRNLPTVCGCLQEENKKLKSKQKDKMQPKMGKLDIDYQVLHDAFFKYQNKPNFSIMGDLYYEGKEFEAKVSCSSAHVP